MKTRSIKVVLSVALVLAGCSQAETPTAVPVVAPEVLPGIYMSNEPANFPFPTVGYTVYIVGEEHGNRETKSIFQAYLQKLYKEAGLRDVVLEEDQAYQTDANAYVHGLTDKLSAGLCLRTDILGQIRDFNASLPAEEQVVVHLMDVDSPVPIIYKHLTELHDQIGSAADAIQIPGLDEFKAWQPASMYALIEKLRNASKNQPDILNGLDTVYWSIQWHLLGNEVDTGRLTGSPDNFFPLREDVITQNMQHLLKRLDGKPVLAFFGAFHAMKVVGSPNLPTKNMKSWGERLAASGVSVYSIDVEGGSGSGYWRGDSYTYGEGTDEYRLKNGPSLVSLFETYPADQIIYTDLRLKDNSNIQLPHWYYSNISAGQVYDGLVIFEKFTPMENACPR